jgi:hypothetical protein
MNQEKQVLVTKANGTQEPFDKTKLFSSLLRAGAGETLAEELTNHIITELKDGMSTSFIYKHAFFLLNQKQKKAALRYSLRRAIMELGPSGFPFEDFVAQIFQAKGYKTETGKILLGGCVEHEVDVVAYNENKLLAAEVKFHNEPGIKTDLKVVLYVKARMEDLQDNIFDFGGKRKFDEGWLVTNTKFTTTAIHYGECKGLKLVGWNYPKQNNLQDLIEDTGLHPLTCLSTLNNFQKKSLLSQDIVLCKTLREDGKLLSSLGFSEDDKRMIFEEIDLL